LNTGRTLFGEWCLTREWGRIYATGGQKKVDYLTSEEDAELALVDPKAINNRRDYVAIPVQPELFQT
jgi:predicted DNA-binding WGR domain protein